MPAGCASRRPPWQLPLSFSQWQSNAILIALSICLNTVHGQQERCVSLRGSTQCPAFNQSSISTGSSLSNIYPFLSFVSDADSFDSALSAYVAKDYVQKRYQQILGCSNVNLTNTTSYYARYTTSIICNSIIQNSIQVCSLTANSSRPLCAANCAQQATSEESIAVNGGLCTRPDSNFMDQIRAGFTTCALPADSLSNGCLSAELNEPLNCGFSNNLQGLCSLCASSSPNATDSCCAASNVEKRCAGITLPSFTSSLPPLFPSDQTSPTPSSSAAVKSGHSRLSGGQIAGLVVGVVVGIAVLLGVIIFYCLMSRRRRGSQASVFNRPTPQRKGGSSMTFASHTGGQALPPDYGPQAGGRIARMSALEDSNTPSYESTPKGANLTNKSQERIVRRSISDGLGNTPDSRLVVGGPPPAGKRLGSLSSQSALGALDDYSSPNTEGQISSPGGVASGQSEQLDSFKDYYSQDHIRPSDRVSVLWAYQPRAADEFELERGEMLKIVGIWDDGWATGVRIGDRAEDHDPKNQRHRDSGVSNASGEPRINSPLGALKAFPLVCVCLPDYWRQTLEDEQAPDQGP